MNRVVAAERALVAAILIGVTGGMANATTVFYTDEATFLAAAGGGLGFESFESFVATDDFLSNVIMATDFMMTTGVPPNLGIHQNSLLELHATDGTQFAGWAARPNDPSMTFSFGSSVTAFGVMITDALDGGAESNGELSLSTNGGHNATVAHGPLLTGNEVFIGLITDTPFTTAMFTVTQMPASGDGIGFDEVRYGDLAVVPEPTTLLLVGTGLAFMARARRRLTPFR